MTLIRTLAAVLLLALNLAHAQVVQLEAGPIWNNSDAVGKCQQTCSAKGLSWNGQWRTTREGVMSVCDCAKGAMPPPVAPPQTGGIVMPGHPGWGAPAGAVIHYPNTDFFSNDISHSNADNFEQCATFCVAEPRCVAFTLSPGRTCFLKSAANRAMNLGGAQSGFIAGRGTPPAASSQQASPPPAAEADNLVIVAQAGATVSGSNACSVGNAGRCPGCAVSCPADRRPVCTGAIEGSGGICQREASCGCN